MSLDVPCEGSQLSYQNRSHFKNVSSGIQLKNCSVSATQTTMAVQLLPQRQQSWDHPVPERNYSIMPVQLVWRMRTPFGSCSCNSFPLLFPLLWNTKHHADNATWEACHVLCTVQRLISSLQTLRETCPQDINWTLFIYYHPHWGYGVPCIIVFTSNNSRE